MNKARAGKQSVWTDVLIIVSIVSVGVVVAGLTSSTSSQTSSSTEDFVTETVYSNTPIPGCDTVEVKGELGHSMSGGIMGEPETYDNPDYPWLTGPKASAMSRALVDALPAGAEVKFASPQQSFVFQPITGPGPEDPSGLFESTSAMGTVVRNGGEGSATVYVAQYDEPVPPCFAGALDARQTTSDGTVVDTLDSWYEFSGQRTVVRSAVAYPPDGSRVSATTSGTDYLVLSVDELASLVQLPDLRTTYPVPAGTSSPPMLCSVPRSGSTGAPLTREVITELNTTLNAFWDSNSRPISLDRPLGSLQLDQFDPASACQDLVYGAQTRQMYGAHTLTMSVEPIAGSYNNDPDMSSPGYQKTSVSLADGSVLTTSGRYVFSPTGWPQQTIELDTVSGMRITVRASDRVVGLPLLQSIAETAAAVFQ